MFVLSTFSDQIRVLPADLNKRRLEAVAQEIEKTYIDKVIAGVGLVVSLYEVLTIEGGTVYPNDGAAHFTSKFTLVVFRPFVGEVITGRLARSDDTGLHISLGFFDDIHIPEHLLQEPSQFNVEEKLWVWKFDENDMFMDLEEEVRLRVSSVSFPEEPSPHEAVAAAAAGVGGAAGAGVGGAAVGSKGLFAPMVVQGEINGDGLGLTSWWSGAGSGGVEEGGEEGGDNGEEG